MVRLAPRIHMPCAVGAISTGAPASTATASPWPTPAAARPPAICRARWWTSNQVCRTGASGSPVFMPLKLHWALANIVSVNLLMEILLAQRRWHNVFGLRARECALQYGWRPLVDDRYDRYDRSPPD